MISNYYNIISSDKSKIFHNIEDIIDDVHDKTRRLNIKRVKKYNKEITINTTKVINNEFIESSNSSQSNSPSPNDDNNPSINKVSEALMIVEAINSTIKLLEKMKIIADRVVDDKKHITILNKFCQTILKDNNDSNNF